MAKKKQKWSLRGRKSGCRVEWKDDGSKVIHMDEQTKELMEKQLNSFKEFFGREPEPGDPIFFDPDFPDKPTPISEEKMQKQMGAVAKAAGLRGELAYAIEKTGMVLSDYNEHLYSDEDKQEFQDAIDEYRQLH